MSKVLLRVACDETVLASLNAKLSSSGWVSYGYYSGNGTRDDGKMTASDYMRYQDVVLDGVKYRAVTFDSYRPFATGYTSEENEQSTNGYEPGTTYWFKYEPIEWRVLDPGSGFIVCNSAIDSQAYNNYLLSSGGKYWGSADKIYYANNYADSSIRAWLNNDFIKTAFSSEQKKNIKVSELNNNSDKIFFLSSGEATNSAYGFNSSASAYDSARRMRGTDYAKCQGLYVANGYSYWWLRSPYSGSQGAYVSYDSGHTDYYNPVNYTRNGVVPAMKLQNLTADPTGAPTDVSEVELTAAISSVEVVRGDTLTWTVTTPNNVVWLRFNGTDETGNAYTQYYKYSNYNKGTTEVTVTDSGLERVWNITMTFNYPGTQQINNQNWSIDNKVSGSAEWNEMINSDTEQAYSFDIKVGKNAAALAPAPVSYDKYTLIDAVFEDAEESGAQYKYFTVTVTDDVSKIRIGFVNETTGKTKTATYQTTSTNVTGIQTENGISTWTIRMKITAPAQNNEYTVQCRGISWDEGMIAHT